MKFKIFGTEIQITFLFMAFITLLLAVDKSGYAIPMIFAVTAHETAHLVTMYLLGCNPKVIKLIPASVRIVRDISYKTKNEVLISISGPLINLFFFALFYVVFIFFRKENILTFAIINLIIAVFNLLPVNALDGGVVLKKILMLFFKENKANIILNIITVIFGMVIFVLGVFLVLNSSNFSLIIISLYLLISVLLKL